LGEDEKTLRGVAAPLGRETRRQAMKVGKKWAALAAAGAALALVSLGVEAQTVGSVASTVNGNINGVQNVLSGGAYLTGAWFGIKSMTAFKDHAEDPRQKLSRPIVLLVIATILLGLPGFASVTSNSFFGSDGTVVDHTGS
jgi:hypothetical protein